MGKAWIRQEVKKDRLVETVDQALGMAKSHPQKTAGIGLGAAAAVALAIFSVARFYETRTRAWEELASAENQLRTDRVQPLKALQDMRGRYASTPAAGYAGLLEGDVQYLTGRYDDAAATYKDTVERGRKEVRPFAMLDLATAQWAGGKTDAALSTLSGFLAEFPEHFLAPEVRMTQARCYESKGDKGQAKAAYEKVALLYPETSWAARAQERLGIKPGAPAASPAQARPAAAPAPAPQAPAKP